MRAKWISQGLAFVASLLFLSSMASATALAPGFIELRGDIEGIPLPSLVAPQSLTVAGQLVGVDFPATTKIIDINGAPQASMLPVVSPGVTVRVKARKNADGGLLATEIQEETALEVQDVVLTGAIDAIDPAASLFTMGGMEIITDTNTEVFKAGAPMQFSDLVVGMIVTVDGSTQADQPFVAFTIKILNLTDRKKVDVTANLEALGDAFVIEMGRPVKLASSTVIVGKGNKPLSFAELQLGNRVHVQAVEKSGNVLVAPKLIAAVAAKRAKRVTDRITRKTASSIRLGRKVFLLPIATRCEDNSGKSIGSSNLRRGMEVTVDFVTVAGVRVARRIQRR
jgi:hypothetical protein